MKLITEVALPDYPFSLDHQMPVLLIGSCFTENMGQQLERYRFPVCINPFGVTYNPLSVQKNLEALMQKEAYSEQDLNLHNDLWFSFDHHTGYSSPDRNEILKKINLSLDSAKVLLEKAAVLILTWGTSWIYRYKKTGQVVCNCHKIPAKEFIRTQLTTEEIVAAYELLLPRLFEFNSRLKILHTVSPVRHWKDGAHGNQLSKAALLLAGDTLQKQFPEQFFYFPSYEIVMDELRDYRFYASDMLHTSEQTTAYIWEKFLQVLISAPSAEVIRDLEPLLKMLEHRPLKTDSKSHRMMKDQLEEKLDYLKTKHPELNLENME
ncbi:MAG: GSCFA domain-containing protein [Bacteroidota bacterium]|nr:GSCFA domain-containing protein [Bacteroidota bacterium]